MPRSRGQAGLAIAAGTRLVAPLRLVNYFTLRSIVPMFRGMRGTHCLHRLGFAWASGAVEPARVLRAQVRAVATAMASAPAVHTRGGSDSIRRIVHPGGIAILDSEEGSS
jgi:hypothetical protein